MDLILMLKVGIDIVQWGIEIYKYCTDFCINSANLLGIDYVTFGSIFFGGVMNIVIVLLVMANIWVEIKRYRKKKTRQGALG